MDRSQDGIRVSLNASRNVSGSWRTMTAAGVASISLACGVAQPALAEWWKSQATKPPAATAKPVQVENGFAATIRRLMSESRRAAAQGDHAKAIQLAERAAKISEASSQLLGSAGECSPQETAKFLADARTRANQSATVAAQSKSVREPAESKKVTPAVAVTAQATPVAAPKTTPRLPQAATISGLAKQAQQPRETRDVASAESPLFGDRSSRPGSARTTPAVADENTSKPSPPSAPLPPSPAQAISGVDELLAQSRLAAADGYLDRAIDLAEQAVAISTPPTLFGPTQNTLDKGADRWLQSLISQRDSAPKSEELVFEPPVKISLKKRAVPVASDTGSMESRALESAARSDAPSQSEATNFDEATASLQAKASEAVDVPSRSAESSLWTEELPPAPAPSTETQRNSQKFSRAVITRAGEWVDADALEINPTNATTENSEAATDTNPIPSSPTASTSVDATPEFPLGTVSTPGFVTDSANDNSNSTTHPPAEQQSTGFVETTPLARVPLKNRGHIQQVADQLPAQTGPQRTTSNRAPLTQLGFEDDFASTSSDASARKPLDSVDFPETTSSNQMPVQRFPIQRVLQLQQRLETASSLNPGGATTVDRQAENRQATSPKRTATVPADWFITPEAKEPVSPPETKAEPKSPEKRGILKLRGRAPIQIEEATHVTSVPKNPSTARQPVVAVSSATRWKTIEASQQSAQSGSSSPQLAPPVTGRKEQPIQAEAKSSAEQPKLSPPVSQVAFESLEVNRLSDDSSKPKNSQALPYPESPSIPEIAPPPPEVPAESPWYHDTAKPDKKLSQPVVVRKNTFALIDQLAETLKIPVSTLISLIGAGGLALLGVGLVVLRATIRRQYD